MNYIWETAPAADHPAYQGKKHIPACSQHNVRLTPNYRKQVPLAIGALPINIETTLEESDDIIKAAGNITNVNQVILEKEEEAAKNIGDRISPDGRWERRKDYILWIKNFPDIKKR